MQLVALVASPEHVCCRYRLAAFRPLLEQAGHRLELVALPRRWWSRWQLFRRLRGATVIVQRFLLPGWQLALLRRHAQRLIFDLDDAIYLRDSYAVKGQAHPRRLRRFAATVRAADAIVAGNGFLADEAARWAGVHRVYVIPTCVDPGRYPADSPGSDAGSTLVWIGSSSTLQGLEAITPLWEELGARIPRLCLKVICDRFPRFDHLPVLPCSWNEAREAIDLATADIGISWVPDDLWSRGKCGLKVLQYMAAGLPVVANPVGVHCDMVRHNETGLLASTPAEWHHALIRLTEDPSLRRQLGQAGRRLVEERYSVAAGARLWRELLERLEVGTSSARPGVA